MPGRKPRTSRVLILIAVLMCLAFGLAVPQSSSTPSPIEGQHMPCLLYTSVFHILKMLPSFLEHPFTPLYKGLLKS